MAASLTKEELNSRLSQLDGQLSAQGLPLRYRPLQSFNTLYGAIGNGTLRTSLLGSIASWFIERYGERAVWDGVIGRIPVLIRGDVYLINVPFTSGDTCLRLTDHIEDLPQDIAATFTPEELESLGRRALGMSLAFQKLYDLSVQDSFLDGIEKGLVWRALFDFENAAHLLKKSGDTQTTIFHSHAAAEKFLKVALKRSGSSVDLQSLKHKLAKIFGKLIALEGRYAWLQSSVDSLQSFAPTMQIRYGVVPRSVENAVSAFNAALSICGALAQMWLFDMARGTEQATFVPGSFYLDGSGATFYCKQLSKTRKERPAAILTRFGNHPLLGSFMMDICLDLEQGALYLEVKDGRQIEDLRRQLELVKLSCRKEIRPEDLGIQVASSPEGSYTTGWLRVKLRKP